MNFPRNMSIGTFYTCLSEDLLLASDNSINSSKTLVF